MKKIILAAAAAATVFAMSGAVEARVRHSKNTQYSTNLEEDYSNPFSEIFGGTTSTGESWHVSPRVTFKTRKQARAYYQHEEEQYGFGHASGSLVAYGYDLQRRGFRVSEHPSFGGVHHVHANHSAHYSGNAIDINVGRGVVEARSQYAHRFDQLAAEARAAGYTVLWRVPGHYDHIHIQK